MSSFSTTRTATIPITRSSSLVEPITLRVDSMNSMVEVSEIATQSQADDAYLPANHGVTGRESDTNPPDWLTSHRRMPPHPPPVRNPEWDAIGGPLPVRIFMWDMFSGCQVLQWAYSAARATGLHERGFCMYKIGNEW